MREERAKKAGDSHDGNVMLMPTLIFIAALAITVSVSVLFLYNTRRADEVRFTNECNRLKYAIEGRMSVYIGLLNATRAFSERPGNLRRERFADFIADLGIGETYKGIQGIGYTQVVRPGEKDALIRRMRAEGAIQFAPYPESGREIAQSIIYLEPQDERNKRAIGFDMSSEEHRKDALDRARDTGLAAMTSNVTLVQEITAEKQPGFLIYVPVYEGESVPETLEERRKKITGFVYAPFRAGDFFQEIRKSVGSDEAFFSVYDDKKELDSVLYTDDGVKIGDVRGPILQLSSRQDYIDVGGRRWLVEFTASDTFRANSIVWWSPVLFLIGATLSVGLWVLVFREASARKLAVRVANDLIKTEREKDELFEKEIVARKQAESANRVKDDFISVVSHELRTPLNAIAGWARILRGHDITPATRESALEKIERNLRLQSQLVEDLLTFSQIASGGHAVQHGRFDLSSAVASVLAELEPVIAEKKLVVVVHDESGGVLTEGDAEKLRLVVLKLLSNAVKFTPNHGQIDVAVLRNDGRLVLSVKDTGRGISEEFLPFIFERFTQTDTSTTRKFGGLGLGLAICEHIVKMHDGTIEAKSDGEEKGAEFVVTLPIA